MCPPRKEALSLLGPPLSLHVDVVATVHHDLRDEGIHPRLGSPLPQRPGASAPKKTAEGGVAAVPCSVSIPSEGTDAKTCSLLHAALQRWARLECPCRLGSPHENRTRYPPPFIRYPSGRIFA
jgi:hypothetical protein